MTVFKNKPPRKPTRGQVLRRMGLIALDSVLYCLPWLGLIVLCLLMGAILASAVIAMFMAVALFWVPWPTDWFLQLVTAAGLVLYAMCFLHLIYKLYRHVARIERNQKEYIK